MGTTLRHCQRKVYWSALKNCIRSLMWAFLSRSLVASPLRLVTTTAQWWWQACESRLGPRQLNGLRHTSRSLAERCSLTWVAPAGSTSPSPEKRPCRLIRNWTSSVSHQPLAQIVSFPLWCWLGGHFSVALEYLGTLYSADTSVVSTVMKLWASFEIWRRQGDRKGIYLRMGGVEIGSKSASVPRL